MIEVEVVKFCKKTNKPLLKKKMLQSEWNDISKKVYKDCYFKAYQLGFSQYSNITLE